METRKLWNRYFAMSRFTSSVKLDNEFRPDNSNKLAEFMLTNSKCEYRNHRILKVESYLTSLVKMSDRAIKIEFMKP